MRKIAGTPFGREEVKDAGMLWAQDTGASSSSPFSSLSPIFCYNLYFQENKNYKIGNGPEINNPKIRFPVLEGDKLRKDVLNGG